MVWAVTAPKVKLDIDGMGDRIETLLEVLGGTPEVELRARFIFKLLYTVSSASLCLCDAVV